jgi:hypothetical protein
VQLHEQHLHMGACSLAACAWSLTTPLSLHQLSQYPERSKPNIACFNSLRGRVHDRARQPNRRIVYKVATRPSGFSGGPLMARSSEGVGLGIHFLKIGLISQFYRQQGPIDLLGNENTISTILVFYFYISVNPEHQTYNQEVYMTSHI